MNQHWQTSFSSVSFFFERLCRNFNNLSYRQINSTLGLGLTVHESDKTIPSLGHVGKSKLKFILILILVLHLIFVLRFIFFIILVLIFVFCFTDHFYSTLYFLSSNHPMVTEMCVHENLEHDTVAIVSNI